VENQRETAKTGSFKAIATQIRAKGLIRTHEEIVV
jgi:hypothetical protein